MPFLSAPIKTTIHVTNRCNLRCIHCRYADPSWVGADAQLSWEVLTGLLNQLGQAKVFRIGFSGGEPLVREDMAEILKYAGRITDSRFFLSTNGLRLTREFIQAIQPLRHRLTIKISLDGPETVHDEIRGMKGLFQAVMAALEHCCSAGITVELATTVMRRNHPFLPELIEAVRGLDFRQHQMTELIPVGGASPELCLGMEERIQAKHWFRQFQPSYDRAGKKLKWQMPFLEGGHELKCNGGIAECGITATGDVVGCRLMPEYAAGSILERPFSEIWNDPKGFALFRDPMDGKGIECTRCAVRSRCHGGCRAYALGLTRDPLMKDPRCGGPVAIDCM